MSQAPSISSHTSPSQTSRKMIRHIFLNMLESEGCSWKMMGDLSERTSLRSPEMFMFFKTPSHRFSEMTSRRRRRAAVSCGRREVICGL